MVTEPHWKWAERFQQTIVPETFVEITMGVIDTAAAESAAISAMNENTDLSNRVALVGGNEIIGLPYYATLEENRWVLDGTHEVRASIGVTDPGFVGDSPSSSNNYWYVQFDLAEVTSRVIPGIDIVWDSEFGEIPAQFIVALINTETGTRTSLTVTDGVLVSSDYPNATLERNSGGQTKIRGDFSDYNTVMVIISGWNTPNHRPRMDRFIFGHTWVFGKSEILSYTHEQSGDLLGAELPKNFINFSLDNTDDIWNPNNPEGFGKYVIEKQMLTVRYGMDVNSDGRITWIPAGVFYLSDWNAPSNGLEASFTARDPLEFMMSVPYSGIGSGSMAWDVVQSALSCCEFPNGLKVRIVDGRDTELAVGNLGKPVNGVYNCTVAEMLQMCACILHCVMWFDREGVLQMVNRPWDYSTDKVFEIPLDLAYSYPEVFLGKPIKYVSVTYTNADYEQTNVKFDTEQCEYGETQSFELLMVGGGVVSNMYADMMKPVLKYREQMTGEFRADPRLDVYDLVNVSTKYGDMQMVLTDIKYIYNGSFRGEFTARKVNVQTASIEDVWVEEVTV